MWPLTRKMLDMDGLVGPMCRSLKLNFKNDRPQDAEIQEGDM